MAVTTTMAIIGGAALLSAGTAVYGANVQKQGIEAQRRQVEQARADELARQAAEEERLKPWREAQTSALNKYREMAENPEVSELTKLRLEEEEKAINKELAAKGLLFSGPAAELRQKSRERIIAEETENAKRMLETVMSAAPPGPGLMPGTAQYDAMIASLNPKAATARGIGGVANSLMAGAGSYLQYMGAKEGEQTTRGLFPQYEYLTPQQTATTAESQLYGSLFGNPI